MQVFPYLSKSSFFQKFLGDFEHLKEKGTLVEYDAFVLYSREDQEFVDKIIEKMEGEYGMKV